jgi:outer membrane immunogenic protein
MYSEFPGILRGPFEGTIMKRFSAALVAAATVAFTQIASAADLPRKAPAYAPPPITYDWTGLYVGGHIGGAWGRTQYTNPLAAPGALNTFNTDPDGFLGGGQIGFNYQNGPWVFGVEGDISWTNMGGSVGGPVTPPAGSILNTDVNWLATATGRIGYAWDRGLLYVKGGAAWMNADHSFSNVGPPAFTNIVSTTRAGWTAGAGVEWAFVGNWSAKLEYNYMDFGAATLTFPGLGFPFPLDVDQQVHAVKIGMNYRFGAPSLLVAR